MIEVFNINPKFNYDPAALIRLGSSLCSPETILRFYLFGKCRQIPGWEYELTALKPQGGGIVITSKRGREGADEEKKACEPVQMGRPAE